MAGFQRYVAWRYLLTEPRRARAVHLIPLVACVGLAILLGILPKLAPPLATGSVVVMLHGGAITFAALAYVMLIGWFLRYTKVALIAHLVCVFIALVCAGAMYLVIRHYTADATTTLELSDDALTGADELIRVLNGAIVGFAGFAGVCAFFGVLRCFFTFFTTVPLGGVFVGTFAMVCVLSVMGGFESDLRVKILGSNAHIQVTREDGEPMTNWRATEARIDAVPGVRASTPFALSEVVIAANSSGQNVVIKGIEPKTVGNVTELVKDLEDGPAALKLLDPIYQDAHDLAVPQPVAPATGTVVDPPPADMPAGKDPIDFSGPSPDAGSGSGSAHPDEEGVIVEIGSGSSGTGTGSGSGKPVLDPPPADLITSDAQPEDFSGEVEPGIHVIDLADDPTMSRRTQSLPGVLVGRELVKQTHLYTGEEVRVVSPLSDPSNPDANGSPIPFNRDFRVAGVFYTGMYEYDLKYVYVSLEWLQSFLDRGDTIDGIEVKIGSPDDTDEYVPKIAAALGPQYRVQDWKELNRSLFSALKLEKIAMFLVLGIVILVASFAIIGNLIMVVVEKQREIALLKTLGATDFGIVQLFAFQGLFIGVVGTALGVGAGIVTCLLGQLLGLPLNPDVYYINQVPIHVDPSAVVATALAAVAVSVLATLYPALLAAMVRPADGIRHD